MKNIIAIFLLIIAIALLGVAFTNQVIEISFLATIGAVVALAIGLVLFMVDEDDNPFIPLIFD